MLRKETSYRLISFALACLLLCTSFSYSIHLHFCQNSLAGISFFEISESCNSDSKCSSKQNEKESEEEKKCCHNEKVQISVLDVDFTIVYLGEYPDLHHPLFSNNTIDSEYKATIKESQTYSSYRPPPGPDINLQILFQSFLI